MEIAEEIKKFEFTVAHDWRPITQFLQIPSLYFSVLSAYSVVNFLVYSGSGFPRVSGAMTMSTRPMQYTPATTAQARL